MNILFRFINLNIFFIFLSLSEYFLYTSIKCKQHNIYSVNKPNQVYDVNNSAST